MVLGVCRAALDDPHDVEDAFQATFLVLVRKAASLRDRSQLGPWLYGVARKVALRARSEAIRRRSRELREVETGSTPVATLDAELRELQSLVREEVDRLPSHDRMAVVFCYLEGLTHEEAAERLGWPVGTVKTRLSRARAKLRDRLGRRGVTLPAVFASSPPGNLVNGVPPSLIASTTLAASRLAAGQTLTAGIISAQAISLMEGVIDAMFATKLKIAAAALAATCAVAVPGVMAYQEVAPTDGAARSQGLPAPNPPAQAPRIVNDPNAPAVPVDGPGSRKSRIQLAEQALKLIHEHETVQNAKADVEAIDLWSRRLAEAQGGKGASREERIKAYEGHLAQMEQAFQRVDRWAKIGQARPLDALDAQYRRDEAARLLAEAKAGPAPTAAPVLPDLPAPIAASPQPNAFLAGGGIGVGPGAIADRGILSLTQPADEPRNKAILSKLEEKVSMNFPNPTPFEDIVKYIASATEDKAAGFANGLPIYVDPSGLEEVESAMAATITINLEGIPLRTTLRLALRQLGLDYRVDGGVLLISDIHSIAVQDAKAARRASREAARACCPAAEARAAWAVGPEASDSLLDSEMVPSSEM